MPQRGVTQQSEVRTYTSGQRAARRVRQRRCLCTLEGLSRPFTHDDGRACPSTLPNPARIGCPPEPSRPGPGLRRALPLRDLPRQEFRFPAPTASASPLDQDERCRRSIYG